MANNNNENRLERIEKLVEANASAIEAIGKRIDSNAKAIQALTDESMRQSSKLYESYARLAAAQSHFWSIQEDYYRRLSETEAQQRRTVDILNRLERRLNSIEEKENDS